MGFLIDASVLIDHERGRVDLQRKLASREEEEIFLSVITASELLHGVHRARDARIRARRAALIEALFGRFPILPIDMATARVHAQLSAHLAPAGHLAGRRGDGPWPCPGHYESAGVQTCSRAFP